MKGRMVGFKEGDGIDGASASIVVAIILEDGSEWSCVGERGEVMNKAGCKTCKYT